MTKLSQQEKERRIRRYYDLYAIYGKAKVIQELAKEEGLDTGGMRQFLIRNNVIKKEPRYTKGKYNHSYDLSKTRPMSIDEAYMYLLGKHDLRQSLSQIAMDHHRSVQHIKTYIEFLEKQKPEWVTALRLRGQKRRI